MATLVSWSVLIASTILASVYIDELFFSWVLVGLLSVQLASLLFAYSLIIVFTGGTAKHDDDHTPNYLLNLLVLCGNGIAAYYLFTLGFVFFSGTLVFPTALAALNNILTYMRGNTND